jgi:hypothetical protein
MEDCTFLIGHLLMVEIDIFVGVSSYEVFVPAGEAKGLLIF